MTEGAVEPTTPGRSPRARGAAIEGYLAIALVAVMALGIALRVQLPDPYGLVVGVAVWGLAWLFAISGARRGTGGARVAAWVSLAALVCHAGMFVLVALH